MSFLYFKKNDTLVYLNWKILYINFRINSIKTTFQTSIKWYKVISSSVFFVIINAIFFSFIFWILTFILKYFYSNKNTNYKLNFYECGFKSLTNIKVQYNINFILIILFLIIYDGEFLVLLPFSLNLNIINITSLLVLLIFLFLLIITLIYDLIYNALEWQVINWEKNKKN